MRKAIVVILLAVVTLEAWAGDAITGVYGSQDAPSCGAYTEARKDTSGAGVVNYSQMGFWVSGYITAYNYLMPNTVSILGNTDHKSVMLWLENYCIGNPLKHLNQGMEVLMVELYPNRQRVAKGAAR